MTTAGQGPNVRLNQSWRVFFVATVWLMAFSAFRARGQDLRELSVWNGSTGVVSAVMDTNGIGVVDLPLGRSQILAPLADPLYLVQGGNVLSVSLPITRGLVVVLGHTSAGDAYVSWSGYQRGGWEFFEWGVITGGLFGLVTLGVGFFKRGLGREI